MEQTEFEKKIIPSVKPEDEIYDSREIEAKCDRLSYPFEGRSGEYPKK